MKNAKNETAEKNSFENWIKFQLKFGYLFFTNYIFFTF